MALAAVALLAPPGVARSRPGEYVSPKLLVHLAPASAASGCESSAAIPTCDDVRTSGDLHPARYFAFVIVVDGDVDAGTAGAQFGVMYDGASGRGVDIFDWTACAPIVNASPDWPAPGSGIHLAWNPERECQSREQGEGALGVAAVVGYFYCTAYTPDLLSLTTHGADRLAAVTTCGGRVDTLDSDALSYVPTLLGDAAFASGGGAVGSNPCGRTSEPSWEMGDLAPSVLQRLPEAEAVPIVLSDTLSFVMKSRGCLFFENRAYREGDTLAFTYDRDSRDIRMNGGLWDKGWGRPIVGIEDRRRSPVGDWFAEFKQRYWRAKRSGSQDPLSVVLDSIDTSLIDFTERPTVQDNSLSLRMTEPLGAPISFKVDLNPPVCRAWRPNDAAVFKLRQALYEYLDPTNWSVATRSAEGRRTSGVPNLKELHALLDAAEAGELSEAQWSRVRELDLERQFLSLEGLQE